MVPVSPQGSLEDGRVIDTSLSRDPLQVELGKRQVIPGECRAGGVTRIWWGCGTSLLTPLPPLPSRSGAESAGHVCGVRQVVGPGGGQQPPPASPLQFLARVWPPRAPTVSHHGREKRRAIIPPHLAYGKRGSPPTIPGEPSGSLPPAIPCSPRSGSAHPPPGDAVLRFDVELVGLSRAGYWQKLVNEVVPLLCLGLVPALLALIGCHLYRKASSPKLSKKKLKEEKRNKAKKK